VHLRRIIWLNFKCAKSKRKVIFVYKVKTFALCQSQSNEKRTLRSEFDGKSVAYVAKTKFRETAATVTTSVAAITTKGYRKHTHTYTHTLTLTQAHQKQKTIANYVRCQPFVRLFTVTVNQQPPPPYPNPSPLLTP